ncbi:MAG: hypothetical protein II304_00170 [Bacteroidales bacterium]|nr:hypothetical protein [Bacteroidales bacterium]
MKEFTKWTRKEFEALPTPKSYTNEEIGEVDSLVILPEKHYHDSGWRCMSFVTIQKGVPTYRISGCSDVIHLGGIGGHNIKSTDRMKSQTVPNADWHIDCLPVSGLLRIFSGKYKLYVGASLSDFELFYKEK